MIRRRVHVSPEQVAAAHGAEGVLRLTDAQARYLGAVLRLPDGAEVEAFDGLGAAWSSRMERPAGGTPVLRLGAKRQEQGGAPGAGPGVVLAQALAKADKLDLVIQKATELGASGLLAFAAARSVVRLEGERAAVRAGRWRRIAEEAARQCGRSDVPEVEGPCDFAGLLAAIAAVEPGSALLLDTAQAGLRLSAAVAGSPRSDLLLIVGPEGGFSDEEKRAATDAGARPVTLGPRVLRTETAGLAALSVVQHLRGHLG